MIQSILHISAQSRLTSEWIPSDRSTITTLPRGLLGFHRYVESLRARAQENWASDERAVEGALMDRLVITLSRLGDFLILVWHTPERDGDLN